MRLFDGYDEVQQLWKVTGISRTLAFEERATVKHQFSLLDLTIEAGIPDDVIWPLIDGNYIVSVSHHDGQLVSRVDDCLDEEINKMEVTLAALDWITLEVKRLSESMRKVNDRKTCF